MKRFFFFIWHIPRHLVIGMVLIYQKILSPDHSFWAKWVKPVGFCKFYPTCSQYMIDALKTHGLIYGLFKGIGRIFRCNPWSQGGMDPVVPEKD